MKRSGDSRILNVLAEFRDTELERFFFPEYLRNSRNRIGWLTCMCSVCYALFGILCILTQPVSVSPIYCGILIALPIFGVIFLLYARRTQNVGRLPAFLLLLELMILLSHQFLYYSAGMQRFFRHGVLLVLLLGFFLLIPNRWPLTLAFSLAVIAEFHVVAALAYEIPLMERTETCLFMLASLLIFSTFSRRIHSSMRMQYYRERQIITTGTDRLTGVYNRQNFDSILEGWLSGPMAERACFSLIMFDIDNFKHINDSYGHLAGDRVLVRCVNTVKNNIRAEDVVARWGGEEFMILLPHTGCAEAILTAERLCRSISETYYDSGIHITASFGVTQYRTGDHMDSIIGRADACLYRAKMEGKNRVCHDENAAAV